MAWLRLTINCHPPYLDDLRDLLEKFGAQSVSYSPASPEPVFGDSAAADLYWALTSVSALFNPDIDLDIPLACIRNRLGDNNIKECKVESVADQKWTDNIKSSFRPIIFADRLCICPSWCEKPGNVSHIVELDPGLAFGTGTHATTALCLDWLARQELTGARVIDYGCGSGILAIAAAKLGASHVTAVDIDQQALIATTNNARKNGLDNRVEVRFSEMSVIDNVDIVMANILLKPLVELAPRLKSLMYNGGRLVLSGILANQAEECGVAYQPWFSLEKPVFRDEWAMLTGLRNQVN